MTPRITFVAGATERRILSRLSGHQVRDGDDMFDGLAKVFDPDTLPGAHPPADVPMNLASQEGEFARHGDPQRRGPRRCRGRPRLGDQHEGGQAPVRALP